MLKWTCVPTPRFTELSASAICQDKEITVLHIESRKSRKHVGDFEVFIDVESTSVAAVSSVLGDIKRRVASVVLNDGGGRPALAVRKTISLDRGDTMCESRLQ